MKTIEKWEKKLKDFKAGIIEADDLQVFVENIYNQQLRLFTFWAFILGVAIGIGSACLVIDQIF